MEIRDITRLWICRGAREITTLFIDPAGKSYLLLSNSLVHLGTLWHSLLLSVLCDRTPQAERSENKPGPAILPTSTDQPINSTPIPSISGLSGAVLSIWGHSLHAFPLAGKNGGGNERNEAALLQGVELLTHGPTLSALEREFITQALTQELV